MLLPDAVSCNLHFTCATDTGGQRGHLIFKYTQHSRLESETFVGVTKALTEGTWTCTLQSRRDVTNPYNWQATYGEMTLAIW